MRRDASGRDDFHFSHPSSIGLAAYISRRGTYTHTRVIGTSVVFARARAPPHSPTILVSARFINAPIRVLAARSQRCVTLILWIYNRHYYYITPAHGDRAARLGKILSGQERE
jgi:hypothetical protein